MFLDLLQKRCSVRSFAAKSIPDEVVSSLLEAGRLSPSGGNEQSYLFGVISDKKQIHDIATACYDQAWIRNAPLLIVLVTRIVEDERGGRDVQLSRFPHLQAEIRMLDKQLYSRLNMEEHQTKIPGTHMVLQALEHGVGSTWVSYFDTCAVSNLLQLPENHLPSEILAFGYPHAEMEPTEKKQLADLVFYNSYTPPRRADTNT